MQCCFRQLPGKSSRVSTLLLSMRKSHLTPKYYPSTYLTENDIRSASIYGEGKWATQFRSLTEYDKKRHDGVKAFVDALRRLEELGILKHCGMVSTCYDDAYRQ